MISWITEIFAGLILPIVSYVAKVERDRMKLDMKQNKSILLIAKAHNSDIELDIPKMEDFLLDGRELELEKFKKGEN